MEFDLVMMQRPFAAQAVSIGSYIKNLGIPLWIDWDDYMLDIPVENKMYMHLLREKSNIIELMKMADAISVPTKLLREKYAEFNDNIWLIPNAFNDYVFKNHVPPKPNKTVLWRGGPDHIKDVMDFSGYLNWVIKNHPDWKFHFAGLNPWMLLKSPNISFAPVCDPFLYYAQNRREAPTIVHIPLNDHVFNRCKSNLGYIEATEFGGVCVCPDWEEWQLPGTIRYTDAERYSGFLEAAINGIYETEKMVVAAWEYITDELMLSKINRLRVDLIESLL
jgi:glycosyltransferase involved in cell wall biosynthesis